MGQLFVNPEKVEELIRRIDQHTKNMAEHQRNLKGYVNQMKTYWSDSNYNAFLDQFNEFDRLMQAPIKQSEQILIPNLKNVKRLAEDYKRLGSKR